MCKNRVLCKKCAIYFRKLHTPKALCHRGFQQSVQLCNFFQLLSQSLEIKNIRYRKIFFIKGINGVGWKLHNCTLCRFVAVLITKLWMMNGQDKGQLRSRPGLSLAPRWSSPGPGPSINPALEKTIQKKPSTNLRMSPLFIDCKIGRDGVLSRPPVAGDALGHVPGVCFRSGQ